MMKTNKLYVGSLLILLSTLLVAPKAIAQFEEGDNNTRIEKYEDLTETESDSSTAQSDMEGEMMEMEDEAEEPSTRTEEKLEEYQSNDTDNYDVRRTEAFNLVSSAYRGDFEDQGVNSYSVLVTNYESGELTAEDLINAAIESGELSPSAIEDSSYIEAVDSQLEALTNS